MLQLARLIRHGGIGLFFEMLTRIGINDLALDPLPYTRPRLRRIKHEPGDRFSSIIRPGYSCGGGNTTHWVLCYHCSALQSHVSSLSSGQADDQSSRGSPPGPDGSKVNLCRSEQVSAKSEGVLTREREMLQSL
jgi:hypothetical protein